MKKLSYKRGVLDVLFTVYKADYSEDRYDAVCRLLEYLQRVDLVSTNFVSKIDREKNVRVYAEHRVLYDLMQEIMNK
jgi:hypothetical protein